MSKLSFRARALDASKPMPIYLAEELPDLPDYSAINRAVPQMPSGMEKEEECEHHLQRAICTGLIIPTPEVTDMGDGSAFDRLYPPDYRMPRQLIHMQPLGLEQDVPDYDMDSEDEKWLKRQQAAAGARKCDLTELKFEETMERLERSSGQTVVTLREARALAGRAGPADHLLAAVYDYWLNKRLAVQQPLLLAVRTEARPGAPAASPYLAFRRRTEKMQTRKNRKNDESSYEKMVKLRRELSRVVSLLELVKKRERAKREFLKFAAALLDKRYAARDFSGHLLAEAAASRVAVAPPLLAPPYSAPHHHRPTVDPTSRQREKRQYKRRKHRHHSSVPPAHTLHHGVSGSSSSSEGEAAEAAPPPDPSGPYAFRRKPGCQYHMPTASFGPSVDVPWRTGCSKENTYPGDPDQRLRYSLTSLSYPTPRCIGLARRRLGRGGRVILDRLSSPAALDRLWATMDYTLTDSHQVHNPTRSSPLQHTNHITHKDDVTSRNKADDVTIKTELEEDWSVDKLNKLHSEICRVPLQENTEKYQDGMSVKEELEAECDTIDIEERLRFEVAGRKVESVQIVPPSDRCSFSFWDDGSGARNYCNMDSTRSAPSDGDLKMMSELLVRRRLGRTSGLTHDQLQDVFKDCLHFKPQSPPPVPSNSTPSPEPPEGEIRLTESAPISVHVRLALPDPSVPPSEMLFSDMSSYHTSEFTLADLYGDSLLPENLDSNHQAITKNIWVHANGPDKLTDKENLLDEPISLLSDNNTDDSPTLSKATSFKGDSSENSSSNHTSVFMSSEGPPSAASFNSESVPFGGTDDSNHAATTNGLSTNWTEFNGGDKSKFSRLRLSVSEKRLGSSVFKVKSLANNQRIYVSSEKPYNNPPSPSQASPAPQQKIFTPLNQPDRTERRSEPAVPMLQVKAPVLPQTKTIKQVIREGDPRTPVLFTQQKPSVTINKAGLLHARKTELVRRNTTEDQIVNLGQQQLINQQPNQHHNQLVTVAMSEALKLRLPTHLLGGGTPPAGSPHDLLGLMHKTAPATTIVRDGAVGQSPRRAVVLGGGTANKQVKVVRALSAAQRSRLLAAQAHRPLQLRGLAGLLQVQRVYSSEQLEGTAATPESSAPPAAAAAPPTAAPAAPAKQPRKGQASLPMEVT